MTVFIMFHTASCEAIFEKVKDVYTKDALLCLSFEDKKEIIKFPLCNVFSVRSDYEKN